MENKIFYVSIKCGEFDFGVSAKIEQLNQEQYNELKSMLVTAIGAMESMRHNSINETNYEIKEDQMKEELKKK